MCAISSEHKGLLQMPDIVNFPYICRKQNDFKGISQYIPCISFLIKRNIEMYMFLPVPTSIMQKFRKIK